ncbi:MAG: acetyl/propionyl-CoA carboxylase alpha subunit, partial [Gammaproteobacteria bacterium]
MKRLLIANRGEVAVRVARTARDMNIETVAIYAADDAQSKHVTMADNAVALPQTGVRAYLNGKAIIQAAVDTQCDALHPGWGFVSENADFAAACESADINFVGPDSGDIAAFADKVSARNLAIQAGIPVLQSSGPIAGSDEVRQQWEQIGFGQAVMLKAVAGGGGRGMALLHPGDDSAGAFERCAREAETGFGNANLYLEQFLPKARHIEVQVVGDGTGACIHLGTRDCSLQRRRQKLIEIAPAPWLPESTRDEMTRAATSLLESTHYRGVGTVEFLCNEDGTSFFFIEVNPRLQVEHTVTEMMLNTDIVSIQLAIAAGATLNDLELSSSPTMPTGFAVQVRVNAERMGADGIPRAATGTIEQLDWAGGPDIRIDSAATVGTHCSGEYDSLLAKVVVRSRQLTVTDALRKTVRVLSECDVRGVHTSLSLAERVLALPEVNAGRAHTQLLDDRLADIADAEEQTPSAINRDESAIAAPVRGRVVSIDVVTGDRVRAGARLLTLESMKMHHDVVAPSAGTVQYIHASIDTVVDEHATLLTFEGDDSADDASVAYVEADLDSPRADLDDLIARTRLGLDAERPAAVAKRHKLGFRTARENVDDLLDNDSFIE